MFLLIAILKIVKLKKNKECLDIKKKKHYLIKLNGLNTDLK